MDPIFRFAFVGIPLGIALWFPILGSLGRSVAKEARQDDQPSNVDSVVIITLYTEAVEVVAQQREQKIPGGQP